MKEVPLHDAKNRLSAIVQEVEETGGEVIITRHGKPVARISRPASRPSLDDRQRHARQLLSLRDRQVDKDPPLDWRDLRDAGRKY